MRLLACAGGAAALLAGCGDDDADTAPTSTTAVVPSTPRPDEATAAAIDAQVAAIYPGVPAGKATDWAVAICSDLLAGRDEATVVRNAELRFAGGDRPDPTPEQAAAIVGVVRASGFCV